MKPTTKRIALIIAGALISGAALMAQGAASPAKQATKAPVVQNQAKATGTPKGTTKNTAKSTSKARKTATTAKASHRRHRWARRAAAQTPAQTKTAK